MNHYDQCLGNMSNSLILTLYYLIIAPPFSLKFTGGYLAAIQEEFELVSNIYPKMCHPELTITKKLIHLLRMQ